MNGPIRTIGDLRRAISDIPDDTPLVRETTGYYRCVRYAEPNLSFHRGFACKSVTSHPLELKSREPFIGKDVVFISV